MLRKADIPKPKYQIGEGVIYIRMSETLPTGSKRELGKVDSINIGIMKAGEGVSCHVMYKFEGDEVTYAESSILRRVMALD